MEINIENWKEFEVGKLFDCYLGKNPDLLLIDEMGKYPLISAQSSNNGICGYTDCEDSSFIYKNKLTLGNRGTYLCLYHPYEFFAGSNLIVFVEKEEMTNYQKLFIATAINKLNFGGYNNYPTKTSIVKETIKLPAIYNAEKEEYEPDWNYMEEFIINLQEDVKDKLKRLRQK